MATEIVFILDKSGSMSGLEKDVIGGFNSFVNEQKALKGKAYLTTILFDTSYKILMDRVKLADVPALTKEDYYTSGGTALLDAIGKTINHVKRTKSPKSKVLVVINTDGEENSSVEFIEKNKIKEMVEDCRKNKWEFIFIGANIDSFSEGHSLGITYTGNYTANSIGTASVYTTVSNMTKQYRSTTTENTTLDAKELDNLI